MLAACCATDDDDHRDDPELTDFQNEAARRLTDIIRQRRGGILADSVGLGKTHVAAALIRHAAARGERVLVSAPAPLRAQWFRHVGRFDEVSWRSHTSLSRGAVPRAAPDFIVIDEAHALRNPATARYRVLRTLSSRARLLLITATPINNSVLDLYHLLRLFCQDDDFLDLGIPDLRQAAVDAEEGRHRDLQRVIDAVVVRRRRSDVAPDSAAPVGRFPRRAPMIRIRYSIPTIESILSGVSALEFPAHRAAGELAPELMRLSLLKRLESSVTAFHASLTRLERSLHAFVAAADAHLLFDVRHDRALLGGPDNPQLVMHSVALAPWPPGLDRESTVRRGRRELGRLRDLERFAADLHGSDAKLDALRNFVAGRRGESRVVIFTEYRDTAIALWRALAGSGGVALIHGSDARLGLQRAARQSIIRRFAPHASGSSSPPAHQEVRVLIATDVLAEGMNLQDARVVISYDLPWNPVRLEQRIGRVDRMGSLHRTVQPAVFEPDERMDAVLGLMRTVRRKIRMMKLLDGPRAPCSSPRRLLDTPRQKLERLWRSLETIESGATGSPRSARVIHCGPSGWLICLRRSPDVRLAWFPDRGAPRIDPPFAAHLLRAALNAPDAQTMRPPPSRLLAHASQCVGGSVTRMPQAEQLRTVLAAATSRASLRTLDAELRALRHGSESDSTWEPVAALRFYRPAQPTG